MIQQDDALLDVSYNELWQLPEMCPTPVISHKERLIIHGAGKQHSLSLFITHQFFKGCILVFEYSYFLFLQKNKNRRNVIDAAVKQYQVSGTQVAVSNALHQAIREHENDHGALEKTIFDIVVKNQMCKLTMLCIFSMYLISTCISQEIFEPLSLYTPRK